MDRHSFNLGCRNAISTEIFLISFIQRAKPGCCFIITVEDGRVLFVLLPTNVCCASGSIYFPHKNHHVWFRRFVNTRNSLQESRITSGLQFTHKRHFSACVSVCVCVLMVMLMWNERPVLLLLCWGTFGTCYPWAPLGAVYLLTEVLTNAGALYVQHWKVPPESWTCTRLSAQRWSVQREIYGRLILFRVVNMDINIHAGRRERLDRQKGDPERDRAQPRPVRLVRGEFSEAMFSCSHATPPYTNVNLMFNYQH